MECSKVIVTLTGIRAEEDFLTRKLELSDKEPSVLIGRSSSRRQHPRGGPDAQNANFSCPVVSRKHAEIFLLGGKVQIRDLNSLHGTSVNGTKCRGDQPRPLLNDDIVSVGSTILEGPQKYFAVVFQVNISRPQDTGTQRTRSFVDLSSPATSPEPAPAESVMGSGGAGPGAHVVWESTAASNRQTYSVPDSDRSSDDSFDDEEEEDDQAEALSAEEATSFANAHPMLVCTPLRTDEASASDSEEDEEEAVFTSNSEESSPPSSPILECGGAPILEYEGGTHDSEASYEPELEPERMKQGERPTSASSFGYTPGFLGSLMSSNEDTSALNNGTSAPVLGPLQSPIEDAVADHDASGESLAAATWRPYQTSPLSPIFGYEGPAANGRRGDDSPAGCAFMENAYQHNFSNEYHPFFPVHGLSRGPMPPLPTVVPQTALADRIQQERECDGDLPPRPSANLCWVHPDRPSNLPEPVMPGTKASPRPDSSKVKDPIMSIDSIVSKESENPETSNSLKRDASTMEAGTAAPVASVAKDSEPAQSAIGPSLLEGEPLPKQARLEGSKAANSTTATARSKATLSKPAGLKSFAVGAVAGGAAVLGALILLPDSVFF